MSFSLSKKVWLLQTVRPLADKVVYVPLKWVAHTTLCLLGTHIGTARAPPHSAITVNCRPIYFVTPDMDRRRLKSRGSESSYSVRESGAGRYSGILMRTGLFMAARCLNHPPSPSPPPPTDGFDEVDVIPPLPAICPVWPLVRHAPGDVTKRHRPRGGDTRPALQRAREGVQK